MHDETALGESARVDGALDADLDALASLLQGRRVAVLTGAGMSTDSGIPDYRGDGSRPRTNPMTVQRFLETAEARQRYWAGSAVGWQRIRDARPNAGHLALARLERAGVVTGIATQNVDSLHSAAGSQRVVELHGHLRTVSCVTCGRSEPRASLDARLRAENPWLPADPATVAIRPDGDADLAGLERMRVPACRACGGVLKPDVVFFGEFVDPQQRAAAEALVDEADAVLAVGTSLVVNTGLRLVHRAKRAGLPVGIVNRTPTPADEQAAVRVTGGASAVLTALADRLSV